MGESLFDVAESGVSVANVSVPGVLFAYSQPETFFPLAAPQWTASVFDSSLSASETPASIGRG
jgi:hypothetical protein